MGEVEETMLSLGLEPHVVSGARKVIATLGNVDWDRENFARKWTLTEIINEAYVSGALRKKSVIPSDSVESISSAASGV